MNMDKGQKVQLGCGTLILIALIVIVFGNQGGHDATSEINNLRNEIQKLQQAVTAQTRQIESLEKSLASRLGPTTRAAQTRPTAESAQSR
jgi:hypothetical protein